MKRIICFFIFASQVIIPPTLLSKDINLSSYTLQMYEDGRATGLYYVVDLLVENIGDEPIVKWEAVTIYVLSKIDKFTIPRQEMAVIDAYFYRSSNGTIYNIEIHGDGSISFTLKSGVSHWRVICSRLQSDKYNIRASRILVAGATIQELRAIDAIELPPLKILNLSLD